jgi:hypothetical protein
VASTTITREPTTVFNWLLSQRSTRQDLAEEGLEFPPYGQVLWLRRPSATAVLKRDAVSSKLGRFTDGKMPFVGILLDLHGSEYYFSSADLGAVVASIAAWTRGWVAPCAIVLTGKPATQLQTLLDITKISTIQHLRIVDSVEAGRRHIEMYLQQRSTET